MSGVLRVGNCSGFYGDRFSAMAEMLDGGELDVLTGDYLAELTMLILGRDRLRDPALGYARTFGRQLEQCLGTALDRGVRIVSNAGGLNPAGLAARVREVAGGLGLDVTVAHVEGDARADEIGLRDALTANAYLGAFGIARALDGGADVVVTGRVTDASLTVGPGIAHFGWTRDDLDALAGAVVAGHVIECGPQATGGNFSGFASLADLDRPLGFPLVELAADGSAVVSKHPGTGGGVTLDTVTAQLLYEVGSRWYLGPDVTVDLDSVRLEQAGPDRVRIFDVTGVAPPATLKVGANRLAGFRNSVELVLTGLDVDAKAAFARAQVEALLDSSPAGRPASVEWTLARTDHADAETEETASARLRCTVRDPDAEPVGRSFSDAVVGLALASYPGFTLTAPPGRGSPYGVFDAVAIDRALAVETVVHGDGRREEVAGPALTSSITARGADPRVGSVAERDAEAEQAEAVREAAPVDSLTRRLALGTFVHARSGDKAGDANLGLWVTHEGEPGLRETRVAWLTRFVTPSRVRELVPEAGALGDDAVEVHPLPHLGGVNVLLRGLLGEGVAASPRFDPQAKGLGEWVRSRLVSIEEDLL